jgi:hypothetical protein
MYPSMLQPAQVVMIQSESVIGGVASPQEFIDAE